MVITWVLFPLVLLAACMGCGLAVEWVGGWRLPGGLLPAVGLALIIVVATLTTIAFADGTIHDRRWSLCLPWPATHSRGGGCAGCAPDPLAARRWA